MILYSIKKHAAQIIKRVNSSVRKRSPMSRSVYHRVYRQELRKVKEKES